ncbi:MAG: cytochrome C biosynthesis protein [Phycisphaerae bacterium]|nr:cytochrome C biosynthesis protein [Phycisphaerae bacterium]
MKNRLSYLFTLIVLAALLIGLSYCASNNGRIAIDEFISVERPAAIYPDYTDTVIPPNIAPLNFQIREKGTRYFVRIYSERGEGIDIYTRRPRIEIPIRPWRRLLSINQDRKLFFDIYVADDKDQWTKFQTITNTIASDGLDRYLTYRKITICVQWKDMGIYQRDLENYRESLVLHNSSFGEGCVHCHSFLNNSPDKMLMQVRSTDYGTPMLLTQNGKVTAVNTTTAVTPGKVGFASWHPNANVIAFSINKYSMLYHTTAREVRDVFDNAADLALYLLDSKQVISTGGITRPDRMETFPEWSRDGGYLYFCSAPQLPDEQYSEVRCDLMRISYDCKTRKWGTLETVLSAQQVNGSITQPRFSPDGRFLLFNVSQYSDFPIHQAKSDLYLMETETGRHRRLSISSPRCDTWHSWSSNGRWIAFNSKRLDGRFARPFFSYVDQSGKVYKPFVLPQKDPTFYDSLISVYNMPELIRTKVSIKSKQFSKAIFGYKNAPAVSAITGATPGRPLPAPKANPAPDREMPWEQRE